MLTECTVAEAPQAPLAIAAPGQAPAAIVGNVRNVGARGSARCLCPDSRVARDRGRADGPRGGIEVNIDMQNRFFLGVYLLGGLSGGFSRGPAITIPPGCTSSLLGYEKSTDCAGPSNRSQDDRRGDVPLRTLDDDRRGDVPLWTRQDRSHWVTMWEWCRRNEAPEEKTVRGGQILDNSWRREETRFPPFPIFFSSSFFRGQ